MTDDEEVINGDSFARATAKRVEVQARRARQLMFVLVVGACILALALIAGLFVMGLRFKGLQESNHKLLTNQAQSALDSARIVDEFRGKLDAQQETIKQGQLCLLSRITAHQIDTIVAHAALARGQHQRLKVPADLKPPPIPPELQASCGHFFAAGAISPDVADALGMPPTPAVSGATGPSQPAQRPAAAPAPENSPSGAPGQAGPPGGQGPPGFPGPPAPPPIEVPPRPPEPPGPVRQIIQTVRCALLGQCKAHQHSLIRPLRLPW